MTSQPQSSPDLPTFRSDGPLGGLLNRIPLQSRLALTLSVVVGVLASVIAGGLDDLAGQIALGVGIGAGVVVAILLAIQSGTNRTR